MPTLSIGGQCFKILCRSDRKTKPKKKKQRRSGYDTDEDLYDLMDERMDAPEPEADDEGGMLQN